MARTNLKDIPPMEERICNRNCGRKFRVMLTSKHRYCSIDCMREAGIRLDKYDWGHRNFDFVRQWIKRNEPFIIAETI